MAFDIKNIGDNMIHNQLKSVGQDVKKLKALGKDLTKDQAAELAKLEQYVKDLHAEAKRRGHERKEKAKQPKAKSTLEKVKEVLTGKSAEATPNGAEQGPNVPSNDTPPKE